MPIDLKRLKADVLALQKERPAKVGPAGRRLTGAMAYVRENLKALEAMKISATWIEIAAGLAAQGVTQGNGQPLTADRLTALIASIKKQDAGRAEKQRRRTNRQDAPRTTTPSKGLAPRARLAPELTRPANHVAEGPPKTEESIRRSNLEKVQRFLKPDNR